MRRLLAASLMCLIIGCGSKSSTGGSNPDFTVSASNPAATTLGTSDTIHVHLVSTDLAASVTLTVTGAPATWTVTPPASPVNLTANGQANADVIIAIPTNGDAAASGQTLTVHASGGGHDHTGTATVTVANQFIIPVLRGATAGGSHWPWPNNTTFHLNAGTVVVFRNDDSTSHLIHSNGAIGIAHQSTAGTGTAPGGTYEQTTSGFGTAIVNCHSHASDNINLIIP